EGYVQVRFLGPRTVKGLAEKSEVFELTGASAARTRLQAAAARGLTRFVGRRRELEVLAETLDQAGRGRGQVVAIVGEPGMGQSRLVHAFIVSALTSNWTVLETGTTSHGTSATYLPVANLLRAWFEISERDSLSEATGKLRRSVEALDRALAP